MRLANILFSTIVFCGTSTQCLADDSFVMTPELLQSYIKTSNRFLKNGDFGTAELLISIGLRNARGNGDLIKQLARVYESWGDALKGDDKIIKLEVSLSCSESETVRTKLRQAIVDSNRAPDSFDDQISIANLPNQCNSSVAFAYTEALRIKDDPDIRYRLAKLYKSGRNYEMALKQLEKIRSRLDLSNRDQKIEFLRDLSDCYNHVGNSAAENEVNGEIAQFYKGQSEFPQRAPIRSMRL